MFKRIILTNWSRDEHKPATCSCKWNLSHLLMSLISFLPIATSDRKLSVLLKTLSEKLRDDFLCITELLSSVHSPSLAEVELSLSSGRDEVEMRSSSGKI